MIKNIIKINENELRNLIRESVYRNIRESNLVGVNDDDDQELDFDDYDDDKDPETEEIEKIVGNPIEWVTDNKFTDGHGHYGYVFEDSTDADEFINNNKDELDSVRMLIDDVNAMDEESLYDFLKGNLVPDYVAKYDAKERDIDEIINTLIAHTGPEYFLGYRKQLKSSKRDLYYGY